jgi:hypothetical protein
MSSSTSTPTNSVLDEIRSTIASFESLRTAGTARATDSGPTSLAGNPLVAVAAPVPMSFPAKKAEDHAQALRGKRRPRHCWLKGHIPGFSAIKNNAATRPINSFPKADSRRDFSDSGIDSGQSAG